MTDLPPKEQRTSTATMPEPIGERGTPEDVKAAFDEIILHGFAAGTATAAGVGGNLSEQDLHRVADRVNPQHMEFAMEPGTARCGGVIAQTSEVASEVAEHMATSSGREMAASGRTF